MFLDFNKQNQERHGLKILTPQQIISRLPISLAQLKAGNNSQKLKNKIRQLLYSLYRSKKLSKTIYNNLETVFMNTLNSKTNESNKFIYQFTDKLNLKNPNKNMVLTNAYNNNKFKISAPTWNDEFNLPYVSYSVSDIQNYFEYIIKKDKSSYSNLCA